MIARIDSSAISVSKRGQLVQNRSGMFDKSRLRHLNLLRKDHQVFTRYSFPLTLFASSFEIGSSQDTSSNSHDLVLWGSLI
jgi:hypothetical protein